MRALPLDIGTIHFVGIGGIGMSGIAEVLHNLGYQVQGSDVADGANIQRLAELGITVDDRPPRRESRRRRRSSSSPRRSSPTIPRSSAARARRLPVVRRAEMLGELMRLKWSIAVAGTHGKTTTTSMVGALLEAAGLDPTVINGGIINAYGTNARLGAGDWMVVEADESDGTFIQLPATIAVVTNIDPEHLDFYGDFDALQQAFETFVGNIPFYGFAVLCIDHPVVQGMIPQAVRAAHRDLRPQPAGRYPRGQHPARPRRQRATTSSSPTARSGDEPHASRGLFLPMFGEHNVQNSLAAIAVAEEMGLGDDVVRASLAQLQGRASAASPRPASGTASAMIDDYGHHPVEIAAVLKAARGDRRGQGHRRGAAAPLHAPRRSVRRVLHLLQRRRHGAGRRRLCRRRGADRRASTATRWSRACARTAIATSCALPAPAELAPLIARAGAARRHRRLPRRRLDHQLGATRCPASSPSCADQRGAASHDGRRRRTRRI